MAQENQLPIYRVNRQHEKLYRAVDFDSVVGLIMSAETERLQALPIARRNAGDTYTEKSLNGDIDLSGYVVKVFHKARTNANPWNGFFQGVVENWGQLNNHSHDFLVFVSKDTSPQSDIYCFTGGSAFNVISDFADEDFPMQLLVRFIDPERIKNARNRMLTGSFYARSNYYRGAHSVSVADAFGAIWKDVTASLKDEIRSDPDFSDLFTSKRELNCEARSSFKIRKRVSFEEGLGLIQKLETILQRNLTPDEQGILDLFETFQVVRSKPKKDEIKSHVLTKALEYINEESEVFDFDVCNVEYEKYFEADTYNLKYAQYTVTFEKSPTAIEILDTLKGLEEPPATIEDLAKVRIETESSLGDWSETKGTLYDHLHGEVVLNDNEIYFLIDRNAYRAKGDFLERMSASFVERIHNGDLMLETTTPSIFLDWDTEQEGAYNERYLEEDNYIVADRITLKGIEFFDLLYVGDPTKLYIIQVKDGVNSKTRDACSQIRNSADMIENSLKEADAGKIREMYRRLSSSDISYHVRLRQILSSYTEDEFVSLFRDPNRERVYIMLCKYNGDVADTNSNIAKFEILSTADYMRMHDAEFKICTVTNP